PTYAATASVPVVSSPDATPTPSSVPIPTGLPPGQGVQLIHFYVTLVSEQIVTVITSGGKVAYLELSWSLKNTTEVMRPVLPENFLLVDSTGKVYKPFSSNTFGVPAPPYGNIQPGNTLQGVLAYVPVAGAAYIATFQWT